MDKEVTVVIPNYNGIGYIENCLSSLREQTVDTFAVCVVDNASADNSVEVMERDFPEVTIVKRANNGGFSTAVNEGIKSAQTPFVLLLNNDTVAAKDFVEQMLRSIKEEENAFSVQALMLSMHEPEVIDDAGDFYNVFGWARARGKGKNKDSYTQKTEIFAACAGAAIYRKDILDLIGLFDEAHFAYLEDIDIGYRAQLYGYRNFFEPKAIVYHAGSASSGSRYNDFKIALAAKNSVYIIYKNQSAVQKILHFPMLFAGFAIKQFFFLTKGYAKTYHKGVKEGLTLVKTAYAKEKRIKYEAKRRSHYWRVEGMLWRNITKL